MSEAIVFLGPTLARDIAAVRAPFDFRAPVAQGDVYCAALEGPRVIGIVDGNFEAVPAVLHKEILFALSRGIHVFGAASMGALRAAELEAFGMRGIGRIFAWYRSGLIEDDGELAVIHGPAEAGFVKLSEAMVDVRATLEAAIADNIVSPDAQAVLLQAAKGIFYKERTWESVLAASQDGLPSEVHARFAGWLQTGAVDQKRLDCVALIDSMARFLDDDPPRFEPEFVFEPTDAWQEAVAAFEAQSKTEPARGILDEVRLDPGLFDEIRRAAALRLFLVQSLTAPTPTDGRIERFRLERGLISAADFSRYLAENRLDEARLAALLASRDIETAALASMERELTAGMLDELRLRGLYARVSERASAKAQALGGDLARSRATAPAFAILLSWYFEQRLRRAPPDELAPFLQSIGLSDTAELHDLLVREYVFASMALIVEA